MTPGIACSARCEGVSGAACGAGRRRARRPPPHIGLASARSAIRRSVSLPAESRRGDRGVPARRHWRAACNRTRRLAILVSSGALIRAGLTRWPPRLLPVAYTLPSSFFFSTLIFFLPVRYFDFTSTTQLSFSLETGKNIICGARIIIKSFDQSTTTSSTWRKNWTRGSLTSSRLTLHLVMLGPKIIMFFV